jgi:hypothetical protein
LAKKARVYDGTAWQELASAQTDLTAYSTTAQMNTAITAGVGLVPILTQTIGTAVSSITVTNAFSATYDNYQIVVSGGVASTNAEITLKLGATATGYYAARSRVTYAGVSSVQGDNNGSLWNAVGFTSTNAISANFNLNNPFLTKNTFMSALTSDPATTGRGSFNAGYLDNTTSYTDFTLAPTGGTLTGGTIRVYGYKN